MAMKKIPSPNGTLALTGVRGMGSSWRGHGCVLFPSGGGMTLLAVVRRCREGRENRPQWRCGIGSQFHDARTGDGARIKPIRICLVKASEKGGGQSIFSI